MKPLAARFAATVVLEGKMRLRSYCLLAVFAGVTALAAAPRPASAQDVNRVVRTLDRILNPEDARRYEERARRSHRAEEEHYWRDYRAGLEAQRYEPGR